MKNGWIAAIGMAVLTVGSTAWAQVPKPTIPGIRPTIPPVVEVFVECPLRKVTTAITTTIPAPWWTTGQSELPLRNVSVEIIAGKNTLTCQYPAAWVGDSTLSVMRLFPKGTTVCRPVPAKGFSCH